MANCNTCENQEKCLKLAPCIVEAYEQGRTDERKIFNDKVDNLKEHYVDACSMCTKLDCKVCHINEIIDDLEQLKERR